MPTTLWKLSIQSLFFAVALLVTLATPTTTLAAEIICQKAFATDSAATSPLFKDFLKQPLESRDHADRMSDVLTQPDFSKIIKGKVTSEMSMDERVSVVHNLEISKIMAAPGHRKLRNPKQVAGLKDYILTSKGGNFAHDPILLNVITDAHGNVKSVDLWNAHHRLVAYLMAGYKKLGDVPQENITVLVNGHNPNGEKWGHYLPIGGIDSASAKDYTAVPAGGEIRVGTVNVDGSRSNFELGSRNSIGQLLKNTMETKPTKVGVYFGTFDPVHEGHIAAAKAALERYGLDEVVMVPNINSIKKPNATSAEHRLEMTAIRVNKEKGLNLYTGPSDVIINQFGRDPFFERINQSYGTTEIYQIIGSDSFKSSVEENNITDKSNRRFIVIPREPGEVIDVPANMQSIVTVTEPVYPMSLSSTKIRNQLKGDQQPPTAELDNDVFSYLKRFFLYQ